MPGIKSFKIFQLTLYDTATCRSSRRFLCSFAYLLLLHKSCLRFCCCFLFLFCFKHFIACFFVSACLATLLILANTFIGRFIWQATAIIHNASAPDKLGECMRISLSPFLSRDRARQSVGRSGSGNLLGSNLLGLTLGEFKQNSLS